MGYFARERIFTGFGPSLVSSTAVFCADDLTEEECRTLAATVQHTLNQLHEVGGDGPWSFELGPSVTENAPAFIDLKKEWDDRKLEIDSYWSSSKNSWQSDVHWLYQIAVERAEIIRDLRAGHTPTVYLQCDGGGGFETFDCVESLTWDELDSLESLLKEELNEMGLIFRLVSDWHAEREPTVFVKAKRSWGYFERDIRNDDADETRVSAGNAANECIEEIKALRQKPVVFGPTPDRAGDKAAAEPPSQGAPDKIPKPELPRQSKLQQAQISNEGVQLTVEDEDDGGRPVILNLSGIPYWGPRDETGGTFDSIENLFEWTYEDYLYRLANGRFVRIRYRTHREADLPFEPAAKRFSDAEAAEWLVLGGFAPPDDLAHLASKHHFQSDLPGRGTDGKSGIALSPREPSDELRKGYRDPDNYWRNVWLYELRKKGKTNSVVKEELAQRSTEFAPIESDNALRTAIESIANYHCWPLLKGKAGRPRSQ